MKPIFAMSDIHGEIGLFEKMLTHWQPDQERLLVAGDMIDRGENPGAVLRKLIELQKMNDVIILRGNHEQMLLDWLKNPAEKMAYYISQGGMETIQTLLKTTIAEKITPEELASHVKENATDEIAFIESLPLYYECEQYVFVHAGVDFTKDDWRDTEPADFFWIREPFLFGVNKNGKIFIFGHTPVQNLHKDGGSNIWVSPDRTRLDIDGGAVFGGQLNGIVVEKHAVTAIYKELYYTSHG